MKEIKLPSPERLKALQRQSLLWDWDTMTFMWECELPIVINKNTLEINLKLI